MGYYITIKQGLLDPEHRKKMRDAVWLFMWYLDKITVVNEENREGKVWGGKPIKYGDVNNELNISKPTYRRWVNILRKGKYIRTLRTPHGLGVTVLKAEKRFTKRSITSDTSPPSEVSDVILQGIKNDTSEVSDVILQGIKNDTSNIRQYTRHKSLRQYTRQKKDFNIFFELYPRKAKEEEALKIWCELNPDKILQDKILASLQNHKESEQWIRGGETFIPHPSNWLSDKRWNESMKKFIPKKIPFYKGDRIIKKFGVMYVVDKVRGELKFSGSEKDIDWETG